jgi:predicted nucleic acid-binding protein
MEKNPIVLDSGALTAFANKEKVFRNALHRALTAGARVIIPTVVVAESTTGHGARDASVNRISNTAIIADCDLATARAAATLRSALCGRAGTVDAIVVATADGLPGAIIITGDPGDLTPLSQIRGISGIVDI